MRRGVRVSLDTMPENRRHQRLTQPLEGTWLGLSGAAACRISDLSWGGCFIQTTTVPPIGQRTVVTVTLAAGQPVVEIPGVVRYVEAAMGFAVTFDALTAEQVEGLTVLLGAPPAD